MRSTHTFVELELPSEMYMFIRQKMLNAGYEHAINGKQIDMHGIAVVPKYNHAEAFNLMTYQSKDDGQTIEVLWNSRDGVTPFIIGSGDDESSTELTHINWRRDQYRPEHVPKVGDRIFVDATTELLRPACVRYVEKYWEGDGSVLNQGMKNHPVFEPLGKEGSVEELLKDWCKPGSPFVLTVTEEWLKNRHKTPEQQERTESLLRRSLQELRDLVGESKRSKESNSK